jgi:IS5 family transposase
LVAYFCKREHRNKPLSCADEIRNQVIAVTRAGGERPFATYKRHYGLARTRFMGLAKNVSFYGLAAIAANVRKGAKFLRLHGLPDPASTGSLCLEYEKLA